MIQYIEELRAELHVESLRDSRDVGVLEYREIDGFKSRPVQTVSPGIANKIRTGAGNSRTSGRVGRARRASAEGSALGCDSGSCQRQSEALCVEILDASVDRVAPGHQVCEVHGEVTIETSSQGIRASADRRREGRTRRSGDDRSDLPSTPCIGRKPRLGTWNIPDEGSDHRLPYVKVARTDPVWLHEQERHGD